MLLTAVYCIWYHHWLVKVNLIYWTITRTIPLVVIKDSYVLELFTHVGQKDQPFWVENQVWTIILEKKSTNYNKD